ncbi:4'-phosphopantetheinyl transferase family protein [Paractinoplanes globisporus]|uniref:4'-phosphopantetheinyl transferase n=1 Tax=Paractinoplanes globisporus TaxID=113565 RepID=A0ABW6WVX2_9ACTN|nr:4'-phosphopantetheinyl transferase superfamily protein [Actinoplanes globisporus]
MIGDLLPPGVAWAERFGDDVPEELFPQEEEAVARAVPKRRREFATGRWLAREALGELGLPRSPIVPGERGAPGWPPGIVGSITHCDGYRAAAVALDHGFLTVAIDAEPDLPLPFGVRDAIARREEVGQLSRSGLNWDRLLFCAKEAVYKAWFPLARTWLDFSEARVTLRPDGTFGATILIDGPLDRLDGRWLSANGLLLAAIALPAAPHREH